MDLLLNEKFNRMAAALAHEVKNPVALIKANVEMIEEIDCVGKCGTNIEAIKKQLKKISSIVTDFIQLTRSQEEDEREQVFIFDLINEITDEYNISFTGRKISFISNTHNEDISLFSSYAKLYILFSNVYKNAVDAIDDNGLITTDITTDENNITITIKDNGTGIEDYVKERLFEPFVTTKNDGSGLGLAICKNIAEEYSGKFTINNRREGGCEAKIILSRR